MSHNTVFGGVSREIEGGTPLIGGVEREIESGLVLVGGVAREIAFSKPTHTLTITGSWINTGETIAVYSLIRIQVNGSYLSAGTYEVEEGTTIKVTAYATKSYYVSASIYLNGTVVAQTTPSTDSSNAGTRSVSYSMTVSGDVSMDCSRVVGKYLNPPSYGGVVDITTS